ncbi:TerD family protein [Lyngbya sp. CCY1209]|jgi:stress response protein SCP2|nr:TerD family protein [Lyngbya sp. CCY1209]
MLMGEVSRNGSQWKFKALGDSFADDMNGVVSSFMQ